MLQEVSTGAYYPPVVTAGRFLLPEHPTWQRGHCAVEPKITWAKKPIISISEVRLECKLLRRQPSASFAFVSLQQQFDYLFSSCYFWNETTNWWNKFYTLFQYWPFSCFAGTTLVIGGSTKGSYKWQEEPEGEGGGWILLHFAFFA